MEAISVTSPLPYTVQQRVSGVADIPISGTCGFHTSQIEASFNGGPFQIVATASNGQFSGVLSGQPQGQGTLVVRSVTAPSTTQQSIAYVGIGDIFSVFGQSNAKGITLNPQQYTHPTLKACCFDRVSLTWGEYTTSADSAGSIWPVVASLYMADKNIPVGFCNSAINSTSVTNWQPDQASYLNMVARIAAMGGRVAGGFYWQGERDAGDAMSRATYATDLAIIADDFGVRYGVPMISAQIGHVQGVAGAAVQAIRQAQADVWASNAHISPGPSLYDVLLSIDGLHFSTDAEVQLAAGRWWAAINRGLYGAVGGRGPQLISATHNALKTIITLTFSGNNLPLAVSTLAISAFTVKDGGTPVTISSASKTGNTTIDLVLVMPAIGAITVSLGAGENGYNVVVPTDTGTPVLPAEIFIDVAA